MAYDEGLAQRVREALVDQQGVEEKRMFGGLTFMMQGNMCIGIMKDGSLMVRVGKERYEEALARPHAHEMDFTGRSMKGFVTVSPDGIESEEALDEWLELGLQFVLSLPEK